MSNENPTNPIEAALSEKHAAAATRQAKELTHWTQWKASGDPQHLDPLLTLYQPLIRSKATEYGSGAVMIPRPALEAELTKHVIGAFQTYDPNRGASLNTHVQNRVQKAKRFVIQHQNIAYIPEGPSGKIGPINRAKDVLQEELGRAPTTSEIADHLRMDVKTVSRIQRSILRDVPGSALSSTDSDVSLSLGPREDEVLSLLPQVLTPDEKEVFNLIYHPDTSQRIQSTTELARRLNKNVSRISRLKTSILGKANKYL